MATLHFTPGIVFGELITRSQLRDCERGSLRNGRDRDACHIFDCHGKQITFAPSCFTFAAARLLRRSAIHPGAGGWAGKFRKLTVAVSVLLRKVSAHGEPDAQFASHASVRLPPWPEASPLCLPAVPPRLRLPVSPRALLRLRRPSRASLLFVSSFRVVPFWAGVP